MTDDPIEKFVREREQRIADNGENEALDRTSRAFIVESAKAQCTYNFTWLGRPVIQYPQDIVALQELIWSVRPDLVVETGIAHGGSLILSASILELLGAGEVLGIDIDIRKHNREAIEAHPMAKRIRMIEGSSIAPEIIEQVVAAAEGKRVLVILDSMHSHAHVEEELRLYSPLVSLGSYLVVMDTVIEEMPEGSYADRPWDKGDNPWTAVKEFLANDDCFELDASVQNKLMITMARDGVLKRVR